MNTSLHFTNLLPIQENGTYDLEHKESMKNKPSGISVTSENLRQSKTQCRRLNSGILGNESSNIDNMINYIIKPYVQNYMI